MMRLTLSDIAIDLAGVRILDRIDLQIEAPGLTVIMGPSGIGKTTLLRIIAGLLPPGKGRRECAARVATIFQDSRLLPWQSALDNAGFGLRASGVGMAAARTEAAAILARLGLSSPDQAKRPAALSGGMRRRVAIARALAVAPDLLLMDEPFTVLDLALRAELHSLIRGIVDERRLAAILVTHDPIEAVTLGNRIVVLGGRPGRIVADLPQARQPADAAEAYAGAAALMRHPAIAAAFAAALVAAEHRKKTLKN